MDIGNMMGGMMNSMIIMFVVIGIVTVVIIVFAMRWARNLAGVGGAQQKVLQNGIPGQAQIVNVEQTSMRVNDNPVVILHLNVQPQAGQPYPVQIRRMIPMFQLMQFQQGAVLPVMIDRENPQNVVIVV